MNQLMNDVIYKTKENIEMFANPLRVDSLFQKQDTETERETKTETQTKTETETETKADIELLGATYTGFQIHDTVLDDDDISVVTIADSVQSEASLVQLLKDATEEFYRLAQTKWKVFTSENSKSYFIRT